MGKVTKYFPKVEVAGVKLVSDLAVGDDIIVIGNTTGIIKSKVESLEFDRKPITKAVKGQEVGLKISSVRTNDEVYVVKK